MPFDVSSSDNSDCHASPTINSVRKKQAKVGHVCRTFIGHTYQHRVLAIPTQIDDIPRDDQHVQTVSGHNAMLVLDISPNGIDIHSTVIADW